MLYELKDPNLRARIHMKLRKPNYAKAIDILDLTC